MADNDDDDDSYFEALAAAAARNDSVFVSDEENGTKNAASFTKLEDNEDDDNYYAALAEAAANSDSMFISEESIVWQDLARQVAMSTVEDQTSEYNIPGLVLLSNVESSSYLITEQWLHSFLPQSAFFYNKLRVVLAPTTEKHTGTVNLIYIDNKAYPSLLAILSYNEHCNEAELSFFSPYNNKQAPHIHECIKRICLFIRKRFHLASVRIAATDVQLYAAIFSPTLYEQTYYNICYGYALQAPSDLAKEFPIPLNYSVCNLSVSDAELIDENWKFRYPNSVVLVRRLISLGLGRGIRYHNQDTNTSELVAWCLVYEEGALAMLYTLESYRGKGLGRVVSHAVASGILEILSKNTLSQQHSHNDTVLKTIGSGPFCFIEAKNEASMKLFTQLGFAKTFEVVWAAFNFL